MLKNTKRRNAYINEKEIIKCNEYYQNKFIKNKVALLNERSVMKLIN